MRRLAIAALIATLPWSVQAAPTWQTISSEPGKRIELDRTSLKRDGSNVQAQGRVVLERELVDAKSGAGYRVIEAITRYDCNTRNASTIKRIYKKNETEVIREEELKGPELPVRSGTLDDKVLREVCRPTKDNSATEIVQKANEAGTKLKEANEAVLKKELAKTEKPAPMKTADTGHGSEGAPTPSIRPNLKAIVEANKEAPPPAREPVREAAKEMTPPAPKPQPVLNAYIAAPKKPAPRAAKAAPKGGYMLELTHTAPAGMPLAAMQHAHIHWAYDGDGAPGNWAALDPKNVACASGQRQSPIDIRDGIRVDIEPIKFDYRPSTFRIVDNGHTVQVAVGDSTITLTGKTYELVQFHFHRPSEERINGRGFDMVAHLVHKAYDGQLAVVAVLMERGSEHPFIQTLWNNMPLEKNLTVEPPNLAINPANLLPADRNYYTYMGSLTTPPCSEGVLWLVMKQPVQISQDQLNIFSRLYRNNARPIQSANGRLIKEGR